MFDLATYFETIRPLQVIGVFGFLVYIITFGAVQMGHMNGNNALYSLLNTLLREMI